MAVHDRMGVVRARIVPGTHVVTADTATTTATHPARTLMTPARMTPIVDGSSRIVKPASRRRWRSRDRQYTRPALLSRQLTLDRGSGMTL